MKWPGQHDLFSELKYMNSMYLIRLLKIWTVSYSLYSLYDKLNIRRSKSGIILVQRSYDIEFSNMKGFCCVKYSLS